MLLSLFDLLDENRERGFIVCAIMKERERGVKSYLSCSIAGTVLLDVVEKLLHRPYNGITACAMLCPQRATVCRSYASAARILVGLCL